MKSKPKTKKQPARKSKPGGSSIERKAHAVSAKSRENDGNETALRESNERLRAIFDTAVEAIITINSAGIIETFNPAAEKLFGYSKNETIGKNVKLLMPSPYREEHDGYLQNYLTSGVAKIIGIGREVTGRRKDGSVFPIRLAVSEVRLTDRILFTGFIEDLTQRKELEREADLWREELERRVEERTRMLAQVNEELEHFAHTISHDLRTPLRGIRNYVDFLTEDLAGKLSPESAEDLQRLGRATNELEQMIEELLGYTRIGRTNDSSEDVDLARLIGDIAQAVGVTENKEIAISGEIPRIWAPRASLRQIFQNLIENGLQYNLSSPKRVEISARRKGDDSNPRWLFSVRDNGIGIDPRFHAKVFGMFQRLHTNEEYPGTGIGLAAVRKAVQHLGGTIALESAPGQGSVFYVELPESCVRENP